jgi:polyhydroxyalkanoate synthase
MEQQQQAERPEGRIADPEAFARNMIRLIEVGGKVMSSYAAPRVNGTSGAGPAGSLASAATTLGTVARNWLKDPQRALNAQAELWHGYMGLWTGAMRRMMGGSAEPTISPHPRDNRFSDPEWSQNQFFDFVKQAYLLTARWADDMVERADDIDEHTRHKAEFYVKQISAALAPSNFVLTNPELLRETLASNGANLVRGMEMLAEDMERGKGELKIRQTDLSAFEVGGNLATTPGKVVFQNELIQLIQYAATTEEVAKRPLLIVPPWINKYYILDLTPEKSFIKWCVEQGHTVFVVSWVNPDARLADKTFEDYMREGIFAAIDAVQEATGEKKIDAVGYCVGGTLLAIALAFMASKRDSRVASATFLATQVEFTFAGDLKVFVDEAQLAALEKDMREKGYLEGRRMAAVFDLLRANDLIWPYVVNTYLRGEAPFPFDLLYWNSDSTRVPAANHIYYLRKCYLENAIVKREMTMGKRKIDLSKVRVPIYNLATRDDHIAPAKSVFLGSQFFGGEVRYVLSGSGHIAGVVNPPSKGKYSHWTGGPPRGGFDDWLKTADEHPGSWWPDWQAWIGELDDKKVPARKIGGGKLKPIEDAPGSYVRVRY